VRLAGGVPVALWHGDRDLAGVDAVILPGGFSYGDYLRCGAIARFAPVMSELVPAARAGLPVLGICNGFQILCEAHLLPGALTRNAGLRFVTRDLRLRVENARTAWTRGYAEGEQIVIPLKSGEGAYAADPGTLAALTVMLSAPSQGINISGNAGPELILPALAAAVIAGMENLPLAFGAGVALVVIVSTIGAKLTASLGALQPLATGA